MKIPMFLAMSAAEFSFCRQLPAHMAWLACHFSHSGSGISNTPTALPANSLLILDDSAPFQMHHPQQILEQLTFVSSKLQVRGVVLDFQRPVTAEVQELALLLQKKLPCPVAAPPPYSDGKSPIFLPPVPLQQIPQIYLTPYRSREIWLEVALDRVQLHISKDGCRKELDTFGTFEELSHQSQQLYCHYQATCYPNEVIFRLQRTRKDLEELSEEVSCLGVSQMIGLWQELK